MVRAAERTSHSVTGNREIKTNPEGETQGQRYERALEEKNEWIAKTAHGAYLIPFIPCSIASTIEPNRYIFERVVFNKTNKLVKKPIKRLTHKNSKQSFQYQRRLETKRGPPHPFLCQCNLVW